MTATMAVVVDNTDKNTKKHHSKKRNHLSMGDYRRLMNWLEETVGSDKRLQETMSTTAATASRILGFKVNESHIKVACTEVGISSRRKKRQTEMSAPSEVEELRIKNAELEERLKKVEGYLTWFDERFLDFKPQ